MKKLYRLWLPQVNIHGDCFDQLCEKCQEKIEKAINAKLVIPTEPHMHITPDDVTLLLGYSQSSSMGGVEIEFCKNCEVAFKKWIDAKSLSISDASIELWVSSIDEVE